MQSWLVSGLTFATLILLRTSLRADGDHASRPQVLIPGLTLELIASEPEIVTPVGLTFDHEGRLLVIESHTHFPPDDYAGPAHDRIRVLEDTNADGRSDRFTSFLEGTEKTMSLRRGPDNWIYVATRMKILRARDTDGDGRADIQEDIAMLETDGDYPHNGLCGLCFDGTGKLYFGLGENLGATYSLVGSDGTRLSGGGEGGNIYQCEIDGSGLVQVATGFWNPFGICMDSAGRLYTVGNDPDASPPCRLVHVVPGGDYGFQFRYGRTGKHPLQAWDGELPGTLPMVAGTSEAPSGVLLWHGCLYSSSWGEHRLERFQLTSYGASVRADREVVVQGDDQFRPVDLAIAPDGSLYFTDWVDRSYNVHGKGRVWRLACAVPPAGPEVPPKSSDEHRADRARENLDWDSMNSTDPFLHHAAMMGLANSPLLTAATFQERPHARQRLAILEAARRSKLSTEGRDQLLSAAIADPDPDVQTYAVRWIADQSLSDFLPLLESLLEEKTTTTRLFQTVIAAIEWLNTHHVERGRIPGEEYVIAAFEADAQPELKALALKTLPPEHRALSVDRLVELIMTSENGTVREEAARSLSVSPLPDADPARRKLADDPTLPGSVRDDLRAGIVASDGSRKRSPPSQGKQPPVDDTEAWINYLEQGTTEGNPARGWRVFFGQSSTRCANCHRLDGRGADVGPDLTGIGRRMDHSRLLESILTPSREIAPRYVPWAVVTESGQVFNGMSLGVVNGGLDERFLTTDGQTVDIPMAQIESRQLITRSIMPDRLHETLDRTSLKDLLALLSL